MNHAGFYGREAELATLRSLFDQVGSPRRDLPGVAVMLRGRRRVGKSRLVEIFAESTRAPVVFFQASQGADPVAERAAFATVVRESGLPSADLFDSGVTFADWSGLLAQLARALPDDRKSIVVIDELPWLLAGDAALEGVLQTVWDRLLSRKPVLLVLVGSDLAMMEQLDDYRRPFHQRATPMLLLPLNPAEVGAMLGLSAAQAVDAHLITGGLPMICQEWEPGLAPPEYLKTALATSTSALLVSGERALAAEFPSQTQASSVLRAIGSGERTWSGLTANLSLGPGIAPSSLTHALGQLEAKRVIAVDVPLSTKPAAKDRRFRVADSYLRFYLAFLAKGVSLIERGRSDILLRQVERSWTSWRGRAVEPLIREAVFRLAIDLGWEDVEAVGGWWNRINNPELDLVGADRGPVAGRILMVGSVKWQETREFDSRDHAALVRDSARVPGVDESTELIAVSRSGKAAGVPVRVLTPEDLMSAWTKT